MALIRSDMTATLAFARAYYYAFCEHIDPATLAYTITLRDERVPMPDLIEAATDTDWEPGCAEPWIANLVAALAVAANAKTVLETGGFTGYTAKRLARALPRDATLTVCEIDPWRAARIDAELEVTRAHCTCIVIADDVLKYIATLPNESLDFAWIDDTHEKPHVDAEIRALLPKMRANGLLTFHDVFGSCDLQEIVRAHGGYALDLPRLGPAGGLGLLQVP